MLPCDQELPLSSTCMASSLAHVAGAKHLGNMMRRLKTQLSKRHQGRERVSGTMDHTGDLYASSLSMRAGSITEMRPPELPSAPDGFQDSSLDASM